MTPDDLAAIRADIDVLFDNHFGCDEGSCELGETGFRAVQSLPRLLAEVDRLTALEREWEAQGRWYGAQDERARIRAAVLWMDKERCYTNGKHEDWHLRLSAVLAAIDGEATGWTEPPMTEQDKRDARRDFIDKYGTEPLGGIEQFQDEDR